MGKSRRKRSFPLVYGSVAFAAFALLLPTSLRPPPDETQSSAEFSPDAPPDEDPDVIIQTLEQARSQTAGGILDGAADDAGASASTTTSAPPKVIRTRGRCFGDPALQIDSPYAAPCAETWRGENGGATSPGVTADEVRVIIWQTGQGNYRYDGPVPHEQQENENDSERTIRVYQQFLNESFEFYGRRLQLIGDQAPGNLADSGPPAEDRAHVADTVEKYDGLFAAWSNEAHILRAGADHGVVAFGGWQLDEDVYTDGHPYLYSWYMDGSQISRITEEYVCKRLHGLPARWAGDPLIRQQPRKFGVISNIEEGGFDDFPERVAARCGAEAHFAQIGSPPDEQMAAAFARFRTEDVTSVIVATDPISGGVVTNYATGQGYFPEWVVPGVWQVDQNSIPTLFGYDLEQWKHAFGITAREFEYHVGGDTDWYRAYKSVDPSGEPASNNALYLWRHILQIANGIQMAGPNLTPETFRAGLMAMPHRSPEPGRFMCCGWTENDPSYADMVAEIFFVVDQTNSCDLCRGTYIFPECGKRYGEGQIQQGEPDYFNGGCVQPDDGRSFPSQGGDPGLYGADT